jgi:hypothetical protein
LGSRAVAASPPPAPCAKLKVVKDKSKIDKIPPSLVFIAFFQAKGSSETLMARAVQDQCFREARLATRFPKLLGYRSEMPSLGIDQRNLRHNSRHSELRVQ